MTYEEYKAANAALEAAYEAASAKLKAIEAELAARLQIAPRGAMNLIAEPIRLDPEYRAAWVALNTAMERSRRFNGLHVKRFRKEIIADRDARRAARLEVAE